MKNLFGKTFDALRARCKKRDAASHGARVENLEKLRKYAEELYAFVCDSYDPISKLMEHYGLDHLADEDGNLIPELEQYQDLRELYVERVRKKEELQAILYKHPEMWRPIEDDATMYYDNYEIQKQVDAVAQQDAEYLGELTAKMQEFAKVLGPIDISALFLDKNAVLDTAPNKEQADLMNEYFYTAYLYFDALATVGDKQDKILWNAVPKVIKDKYVQFADDKMVEILASDDRLVECVKNFDGTQTDPDAHERFIRLLEQKLNTELFNKTGHPISMDLYFDKYGLAAGQCNQTRGTVSFNTAHWGKIDNSMSESPDINNVIGTIKHEILGHYANFYLSEMGLYGKDMKDFMKQIQQWTHGELTAALDTRVLVAISPLLKQHYVIEMPQKDVLQELKGQGWSFGYYQLKDDFELYQSNFEERSAWLITPTSDIVGKIDRYRAAHGPQPTIKTR